MCVCGVCVCVCEYMYGEVHRVDLCWTTGKKHKTQWWPHLSPCRHMDDEQSLEIENSVLDRCIHHGGVVHIFVDRKSTYVSIAASCLCNLLSEGWEEGRKGKAN